MTIWVFMIIFKAGICGDYVSTAQMYSFQSESACTVMRTEMAKQLENRCVILSSCVRDEK